MSYLGPLRMHFAGRFQAAVSTVNNDPNHYDNAKFKSEYQEVGRGGTKGWWNPRGDADWRLIGCGVTSAWLADGSPVAPQDPVLSTLVADSDRLPPAKLVDLDPCQQLVSTIWGLEMRIADQQGNTLLRGSYEPAAFFDIWDRALSGGGDIIACAAYQSVLTDVEWGDVESSPFLSALRDASRDGLLSVKFMLDAYNMTFGDPEFTRGRIVGTIGPAVASEPAHMVLGRQFTAEASTTKPEFFLPAGGINFCAATVDAATAKVYLDLGNSLRTGSTGEPESIGAISLYAGEDLICAVPYTAEPYPHTAGILALPAGAPLSAAQLEQIVGSQLSLRDGTGKALIEEAPLYVRADQFVYRCDPGDTTTVRFYASRLGQPYAGATVALSADPSQLQGMPEPPSQEAEPGLPKDAIAFPATATTAADGTVEVNVAVSNPGSVRVFLDGQVYGIRPRLSDDPGSPADPWNFVSLLVWSSFHADDPPTWLGSLQPIFQQYANLYPIMGDFLDLADYEAVCANRKLLLLAFDLDTANPNSMPVTRDLSSARREAILAWLTNVGADGKPLYGTSSPQGPVRAVADGAGEPDAVDISRGGKAAAAARRLILTREAS
jgi:hypothetical protein